MGRPRLQVGGRHEDWHHWFRTNRQQARAAVYRTGTRRPSSKFERPRNSCRFGIGDWREGSNGPRCGQAAKIVIVTIPEGKIPNLPKDLFTAVPDDVVIVDTGNYYPQQRDGRIVGIEDGITESRWVANQLGRPFVKAFNNIYAQHLLERGRSKGTPGRIALRMAGDGQRAKEIVMGWWTNWGSTQWRPEGSTNPGGNNPARLYIQPTTMRRE